ncbi:MAG: VWA domain-containing protein [Herpetosiphonaceae bacterium]|nr:VWA domain-containing protein [Herpetosiphonaceae bacterium]
MSVLAPLLLGLGLLALPVVAALHLLQQRRRRVRVPALELWHDPTPLVRQRSRRLPITWPLLLRLLIAALLALALGRPLLHSVTGLPTTTALLLDTSTSMAATDIAPSRLGAAQLEARRAIAALRTGDQLAIIDLSNPPRLVARGGPDARTALEAAVDRLQAGGHGGSLQAALDLASSVQQSNHSLQIVVLTDTANHAQAPLTAPVSVDWRTFGTASDNVAFVAFAARSTTDGLHLYARVANLGSAPVARTMNVALDGQLTQTEPIRLEAHTEAEWSWPLPKDTAIATANLDSSDAFADDDQATLLLRGNTTLHALLVSPNPSPLERALRALSNVSVTTARPDSYSTAGNDLTIFSGYMPATLPPVPTWIVAPPTSALLPVSGTSDDVVADSVPDNRFAALDLHSVHFGGVAMLQPPAWSGIALGAGSTPLILAGFHAGQPVTIWSFDPDQGGLANRVQFPLLVAATLRTVTTGLDQSWTLGDQAPKTLHDPAGSAIDAGTPFAATGLYRTPGNQPALTVNVLDAEESDLSPRPAPVIEINTPTTATTTTRDLGRELWLPVVGLVCLMLLLEGLGMQLRRSRRTPQAGRL